MISIPPKYVNVEAPIVYDTSIPSSMLVTYLRLKGLSWKHQGLRTDTISLENLLEITGLKRRAFYEHLRGLSEMVPLRWESRQPGYLVLFFDALPASGKCPDISVQKNAQPLVVVNKDSLNKDSNLLLNESLEGGVGGDEISAEKCTAPVQKNAQLLQEAGVSRGVAEKLVFDLPSERIEHALNVYRQMKDNGKAQGAGWLVRFLEEGWPDPPDFVPVDQLCPLCRKPWSEKNERCRAHRMRASLTMQDFWDGDVDVEAEMQKFLASVPVLQQESVF